MTLIERRIGGASYSVEVYEAANDMVILRGDGVQETLFASDHETAESLGEAIEGAIRRMAAVERIPVDERVTVATAALERLAKEADAQPDVTREQFDQDFLGARR